MGKFFLSCSWGFWLTALAFFGLGCSPAPRENQELIVGSAISLRQPLEILEKQFEAKHPDLNIIYQFASSGSLRFQIENGAPIDAFIAAHSRPVQTLVDQGHIEADQVIPFLKNRLALAWSQSGSNQLKKLDKTPDFLSLAEPEITRIALGEPRAVPAGIYALQVLQALDLDRVTKGKRVLAKDALQIVTYLQNDHVQAGLLYSSDLRKLPADLPTQLAPEETHESIQYLLAPIKNSPSGEIERFLDFLQKPESQEIFASYGFFSE